eukprot:gene28898-35848_t
MEVFWNTTFNNVHKEFRSLATQKQFWQASFMSNILQYGLGFVRVALFFSTNGHAASSANCDAAFPVGSSGLDTILALSSSIIAYLMIFPLVYLLSQILVPDFRLQKGTVKVATVTGINTQIQYRYRLNGLKLGVTSKLSTAAPQ